jgi:MFS family permease
MRAQIGTLIIATSVIQLANGFFGTFISLRVASEDFGATLAGLVLSSYFAGFALGAVRCGQIIKRVGHIRAYATFAGLVVAASAAMPLRVGPLPWLVLRAIVGFGCAGVFVTTERWLNAKAQPSQRGRVFSLTWSAPSWLSRRESPGSAAHTPSTALPHILSPPTLSSFQMPGSLHPSTSARTDS